MSDAQSYTDPFDMMGDDTVAEVVSSNLSGYEVGDIVVSQSDWQDYSVSNGEGIYKLDKSMSHPSYGLGVLGMPGFTGHMGLTDIGKPQAGETLGFDECIDHHADDFAEQLVTACKDGIDIYYENVGGKVFDAVLPLLNAHARIPLCGMVSPYNNTELHDGKDRLSLLMATILKQRMTVKGFIIFEEYGKHFSEFL